MIYLFTRGSLDTTSIPLTGLRLSCSMNSLFKRKNIKQACWSLRGVQFRIENQN